MKFSTNLHQLRSVLRPVVRRLYLAIPSLSRRETERKFLTACRAMGPGSLAIDCGANVGRYTEFLALTGATVHAFEPHPAALEILRTRLRTYPNVTIHATAVSDSDGEETFFFHARDNEDPVKWSVGASLLANKPNVDQGRKVRVRTVDLSRFIQAQPQPIDLLKIDVEGAEGVILEGLFKTGAYRQVRTAFVETHEKSVPELEPRIVQFRDFIAREGLSFDLDWH